MCEAKNLPDRKINRFLFDINECQVKEKDPLIISMQLNEMKRFDRFFALFFLVFFKVDEMIDDFLDLGMLALVIFYLIWKARGRLCRSARSSSAGLGNPRLSTVKFDLDYWLKQVDLLEAKEAERNRGGQSLYLELPKTEARDNREATATWIVDAYRHWRLIRYRQQQHLLRPNDNPSTTEPISVPYRRRRYLFRRFVRRFFNSSRQNPSFLMEQSQSLIAGVRPSIVSNHFIPPILTSTVAPRRTSSWPRLKSTHPPTGIPMSALQTQLARKRLLRRASGTTFEM